MKIIGLDISTTFTGWTILDNGILVEMGHIEFKKCKTLWEKVDHATIEIQKVFSKHQGIEQLWVEESLQAFYGGGSSAATIAMLTKFNALICYQVRQLYKLEPNFIGAISARNKCGIKIQKTKKVGKSGKVQTFEWATTVGPLKDWRYPQTSTNKPKPYCYDECDSFVIALSGWLSNN